MTLKIYSCETGRELKLPFADQGVKAGFPSPAQDFSEESIDFNSDIVKHPASTYYVRVIGDSMIEEYIEEDDLLLVDKALEPQNGSLAVCMVDGEATLKRIHKQKDRLFLLPANRNYKPIEVTAENEFMVWGVVDCVIKKIKLKPVNISL